MAQSKELITNWQEKLLWVFAFMYFLYFTAASFLKYDHFFTGRFDLGNMAQTVWNTLHGSFFQLTDPNGVEQVSRLAFHADFILIFLTPFYFIWENPKMLLLIQTLVLTFGGIYVYKIAEKILKNKTIALVLAACFFLNPAVNYVNLFDFHAVALATTFILASFYYLFEKRYIPMIFFLFLAALTKEQVWFIVGLIGVYLAFKGERKLGILLSTVSFLVFYLLIWHAIPNSLGSEHFALSYYSEFGKSPTEIVKNIFLSPVQTLQTILMPDRIAYLRQLFMPFGYLSFLAPLFLIFAGPDLTINLLSDNATLHQIYYQYSSTITPFIFLSVIFGIKYLRKWVPQLGFIPIGIFLLVMTLVSAYNYGPLPFAKKPTLAMFNNPLPNKDAVDSYLEVIPPQDKVAATNNLGSHLSHRKDIYVIPVGIDRADRVLFLMGRFNNQKEKDALEAMFYDPNFYLIYSNDDFYVFKRL